MAMTNRGRTIVDNEEFVLVVFIILRTPDQTQWFGILAAVLERRHWQVASRLDVTEVWERCRTRASAQMQAARVSHQDGRARSQHSDLEQRRHWALARRTSQDPRSGSYFLSK